MVTEINCNLNDENVSNLVKSLNKKENSSFENMKEKSTVLCETNNECESTEVYNNKTKKMKLKKNKLRKNTEQVKCSVKLNVLSQSREVCNESNYSAQKQPEISVPEDESIKNIKDKSSTNINNCSPYLNLDRLNSDLVKQDNKKVGVNKISRNKSNFKNTPVGISEISTNVFVSSLDDEQNLILDSSPCLASASSHSVNNSIHLTSPIEEDSNILTKDSVENVCPEISANCEAYECDVSPNSFPVKSLDLKLQENEPILITEHSSETIQQDSENIQILKLQSNEHSGLVVNNLKERVSDIETDPENILALKLQQTENNVQVANNSSEVSSNILVEEVSKTKVFCDNTISDDSLCLNSSSSIKETCPLPIDKAISSISETDIHFEMEHSVSEIASPKENISSDLLYEKVNNSNPNSVTTKMSADIQNSANHNSTSNRLKTNIKSCETKSSNNTEPFILGLSEDEFDYELDQQYDSDSCLSVSKASNDNINPSFKAISNSLVQDHLNKMNSNRNILDSSLTFKELEHYSSYDDDSDSDKEYSFKRSHERRSTFVQEPSEDLNSFKETSTDLQDQICESYESLEITSGQNNLQLVIQETCENDGVNPVNSTKVSPRAACLSVKDVKAQINEKCRKEMVTEAIQITRTYISISSARDTNKSIFKRLLSSVFSFIMNSINCEIPFSNIFDDILTVMHEFDIHDSKISSYFIIKCCDRPELKSYIKKTFDHCQEKNIPLKREAINAFSSVWKFEELTLSTLLNYMNYIKFICKKKIPKIIIHSALEKSKTGTKQQSELHPLYKILNEASPKEIDELNLKEFLQLCFKNSMWPYIAEMLMSWNAKNNLSLCIYFALVSESESMAKYYAKFANAFHDNGDDKILPEQKIMFGQIGVALMLNAFEKNRMDHAQEILSILHRYNVNYFELELAVCRSCLSRLFSDTDKFETKILPFLVVFTAVDICLHLERPKDAFIVFQDFSWVTPEENLDKDVYIYVLKERYNRLIKMVPLLNNKESLYQGWEALKILLTAVEQGLVEDFLIEKNKVCTEDNSVESLDSNLAEENTKDVKTSIQCIQSIYNEYLTSLINFNEISSAFDLYQHSCGPKKDIFNVMPYVLRGLVVAFSNDGKTNYADAVFRHGLLMDVYSIKKPEISSIPWELTIESKWTIAEIKLVVNWFIKMLSPLLSAKPKETNFEKWFSMKIIFKISNLLETKIKCLEETSSDSKGYLNKTKLALQNMNPSLQYTEEKKEDALIVTSDSLYSYWKSKCFHGSPKFCSDRSAVLHPKERKFSFGEIEVSSEKKNSLLFYEKKSFQSPDRLQTDFVESVVSDYIDEIKSKKSTATFTPVSPKTSPSRVHENVTNISPRINFLSPKEASSSTFKNIQGSSQKLKDAIIQIRNPSRISDIFSKESKISKEKDSLDSSNLKNKNTSVKNICNLKNSGEFNTPKLKKKVNLNAIKINRLKKLKTNSPNTKKLTNGDMGTLTVSFGANSSSRIVSNISQNVEKSSPNLNSKLSVKVPAKNTSDLKTIKTSVLKKTINLKKSNSRFKKETNTNMLNQSLVNVGSSLVVNIPVKDSNTNRTEQARIEPLIVSVTSTGMLSKTPETVPNDKMPSKVFPQNKNYDAIVFNDNFAQCRDSKPVIKRNINLTYQSKDINESKEKTVLNTSIKNTSSSLVSLPRKVCDSTENSIQGNPQKVFIKAKTPTKPSENSIQRDPQKVFIKTKTPTKPSENSIQGNPQKVFIKTKTPTKLSENSIQRDPQKVFIKTKTPTTLSENSIQRNPQKVFIKTKTPTKPFSGISCSSEEREMIIRFLQSTIANKHKHLSDKEKHEKAVALTETFIQNNNCTKLDHKMKKILTNFANTV